MGYLLIRLVPLCLVFLVSGCGHGYGISQYGASVKNVIALKSTPIRPVAVARFEATTPGRKKIMCRAAGPVSTPDNQTFESYIGQAFIDELTLAGLYDPQSVVTIRGVLQEVNFNSNIGVGKWVFRLAISSNRSEGFTVESVHNFSTDWVAARACQQVAQEFGPAVQRLISDVIANPAFSALTH